jgi:hypothetical protein
MTEDQRVIVEQLQQEHDDAFKKLKLKPTSHKTPHVVCTQFSCMAARQCSALDCRDRRAQQITTTVAVSGMVGRLLSGGACPDGGGPRRAGRGGGRAGHTTWFGHRV